MNRYFWWSIFLAIAFLVGYLWLRQASHSEPNRMPSPLHQEVRPEEVPTALEPAADQDTIVHFIKHVPKDHSYRIGFIGNIWPEEFPRAKYNKEILEALFNVLKVEEVQLVFISDRISLEDPETPREESLASIDVQLKQLQALFLEIMGPSVPLFPVFDMPIEDQNLLIPVIAQSFHLPVLSQSRFYDVTIGNTYFLSVPTHDFAPDLNLDSYTNEALEKFAASAKYRFVCGFNPVFPVTSTITNAEERYAFWQVLKENQVRAYFSFGEEVFNRVQKSGVWEIMTGGGGGSVQQKERENPFVHCVILRIPTDENSNPIVQVLDFAGEVIDELELVQGKPLLHELHITLLKPAP